MERRTFEDSFKDAFSNAEDTPSEQVWTNIELELEKEAGDNMRRKLVFYKILAAASIAFALSVVGIGYYALDQRMLDQSGTLAQRNESISEQVPSQAGNTSTAPDNRQRTGDQSPDRSTEQKNPSVANTEQAHASPSTEVQSTDESAVPTTRFKDASLVGKNSAKTSTPNDIAESVLMGDNAPTTETVNGFTPVIAFNDDRTLPSLYQLRRPTLTIRQPQEDPVAAMLRKLAAEEQQFAQAEKKERTSKSEKVWTSVGFAAGGFSSVNHGITSPAASNTAYASNFTSVPDKQSKASGTTYSMGVNFGTKVAKRWILQGGVNYLTQSSDYTANNVVADLATQSLKAESINALSDIPLMADAAAASNLKRTFPYSVNNNVKFFSVPVQAGYLIVNQKFGLQLNAGLSTDLFLENTITPEGGSLDKTTQGRGEDSPYRSVNFSGLMGTELSYRFGQHYRISLNPGLRYPLNSVYKSDIGIESTPLTFDVGLRFRYIFK